MLVKTSQVGSSVTIVHEEVVARILLPSRDFVVVVVVVVVVRHALLPTTRCTPGVQESYLVASSPGSKTDRQEQVT